MNGTWGTAEQVPGLAALNNGGESGIVSVSCGSAGNCSAGGNLNVARGKVQPWVAVEANGTWGAAEEAPGIAALNKGKFAKIFSVSCGSAGNCSAGGEYKTRAGNFQAFVLREANGTWSTAEEVPGIAGLNKGGQAAVNSVSCASAGSCSVGGSYLDSSGHGQTFVTSEANGTWSTAKEVPGIGITSVSCASAGNCSAGGSYRDSSQHVQAFVVNQVNGTWGKAEEAPGTAALNMGGFAEITSVSCASAGNCSAGGTYTDRSGHQQVFVVGET